MNLQKKSKLIGATICLLALSTFIYSCKKSDLPADQEGPAKVFVNLLGVESNVDGLLPPGIKSQKLASLNAPDVDSDGGRSYHSGAVMTKIIPFSDNLSILATLVPEGAGQQEVQAESKWAKSQKLMSVKKPTTAATPIQDELGDGIRYRVVVYDSLGNFAGDKLYSYGSEAAQGGFTLDGEADYTFIAYSMNSTTTLRTVSSAGSLTNASVNNVTTDLMYFKKDMKLSKGDNYLDVLLKHQFSQITTTISLSEATEGMITSINSAEISPVHINGSLKLSDGTITYGTEGVVPLEFPSLGSGVRSITATPTVVIAPTTTTAQLNIGSITAAGHTKEVVIDGLNITPGVRYNLNLEFIIPCTQEVVIESQRIFDWSYANGEEPDGTVLTHTIDAPAADFGFVFNLLEVDNSFSLTINGTPLIGHATSSSTEVQFEDNITDSPQNIEFADGSFWGEGSVPALWYLVGTAENPMIRVVIDGDGKVSIYGSKASEGELFPLTLTNGFYFNDINWNKTEANTVVVSQLVKGITVMRGNGSGKQVIPCP